MATRKPYHHGDLRRALLDGALQLAEQKGPAAVSLREAARVAGVSHNAPYRHFDDKLAMLAAASEEGFVLLHAEMQAALAACGPEARSRLVALAVAYVRFALHHPAHFRMMYGHRSPPKAATAALQRAARDVFQLFLGTVEGSLASLNRARDPKKVLFQLWALAHGIAALALEKQILFDVGLDALTRAVREAVSAHLDGLALDAPADRRLHR
jgi:AcrR family transcriptional regulator